MEQDQETFKREFIAAVVSHVRLCICKTCKGINPNTLSNYPHSAPCVKACVSACITDTDCISLFVSTLRLVRISVLARSIHNMVVTQHADCNYPSLFDTSARRGIAICYLCMRAFYRTVSVSVTQQCAIRDAWFQYYTVTSDELLSMSANCTRAATNMFDTETPTWYTKVQQLHLYRLALIQLQDLWYMDTHDYTSYSQWLPQEIIDDLSTLQ